jgi:hypothetical protein
MSMSEPFLPADEPHAEAPPTDRDIDTDTDVIRDTGSDASGDGAEDAQHYAANPVFRTPTPGATLSEQALEKDLDEE